MLHGPREEPHPCSSWPGSGAQALVNYYVGEVVGAMDAAKPAGQVMYEMIDEFVDAVTALGLLLED